MVCCNCMLNWRSYSSIALPSLEVARSQFGHWHKLEQPQGFSNLCWLQWVPGLPVQIPFQPLNFLLYHTALEHPYTLVSGKGGIGQAILPLPYPRIPYAADAKGTVQVWAFVLCLHYKGNYLLLALLKCWQSPKVAELAWFSFHANLAQLKFHWH